MGRREGYATVGNTGKNGSTPYLEQRDPPAGSSIKMQNTMNDNYPPGYVDPDKIEEVEEIDLLGDEVEDDFNDEL